MRNNTKVKKLMEDHTLTLSMNNDMIEMIVTGDGYSFVCEGKSLTNVFDAAIRTLNKYAKGG